MTTYNYAVRIHQDRMLSDAEVIKGIQDGTFDTVMTEMDLILAFYLQKNIREAFYQLENSKTGYKHWQIHIITDGPYQKNRWDCYLGKKKGEYFRAAKNAPASIAYAQKDDTRVSGPFHYTRLDPPNALEKMLRE